MKRLSLLFLLSSALFLASVVAALARTQAPGAVVEVRLDDLGLSMVDRCPTCHQVKAGAELPEGHPAVPGYHPVERFGCALCHGGEPRALQRDWAHERGRSPLLHLTKRGEGPRRERLEAACARCHVRVDAAGLTYDPVILPHVASGQGLFLSRGCWGCHRIDAVSEGERGPDLSDAGARLSGDELDLAIFDPGAAPSSTTMPRLRLSEGERQELVAFLLAQVGSDRGVALATARRLEERRPGAPPARAPVDPGMAQGGELMLRLGCSGCHRLQARDGQVGPDLTWEGMLRGPRFVHDMITRPASTLVGSRMPPLALHESEVAAAEQFLSRQTGEPPESEDEAWSGVCARCHGLDGRGRTAVAPYLQRRPRDLGSEEFFRAVEPDRLVAAVANGVPGTPMAPWAEAVPALGGKRVVSYLSRKLHRGVLPSPGRQKIPRPPEKLSEQARSAAEKVFSVECSSCHGPTGRGDGPEAGRLRPRPRDLGNGAFVASLAKRRVYLSIAFGVPGSEMPAHIWGNTPDVIWALEAKVRSLAGQPLTGTYEDDRWPWQKAKGRPGSPERPGKGRREGRPGPRLPAKSQL